MSYLRRLIGRDDVAAIKRYESLLRNAPAERAEEVHLAAFARLTARQRDLMFAQIANRAAVRRRVWDDRWAEILADAIISAFASYAVGLGVLGAVATNPDRGGADSA
jgi:hypothetical protein